MIGGGYFGIGIGGEAEVEVALGFGSFLGGVEGREEKRFKPGNDAIIAMKAKPSNFKIRPVFLSVSVALKYVRR